MRSRGQASVEWLALVALVAVLLAGAAAVLAARGLPEPPGAWLGASDPLQRAYGEPTARLVRRYAPALLLERGIADAPVDPRACRAAACARGARGVLFTHVVRRGAVTYVQYWAYWPDSSWNGIAGRHRDDWESFQVRVNADGSADARASAHRGYTGGRIGPDLNVNQVRPQWVPPRWRAAWVPWRGGWRVARYSHAGYVTAATGGRAVALVPLEPLALPQRYAVAPPWRKLVWSDPESWAT